MKLIHAISAAAAVTMMSCAASRQDQTTPPESGFAAELASYEASFHPSDYDPDTSQRTPPPVVPPTPIPLPTADTVTRATPDVVQGFRVQVFSSMRIDEARNKKAEVEALFPSEWFYLEYDSPAYKVRAGNFLTRFDAEKFVKQLADRGYSDAWTVPARVFKNPPPPSSPATPDEQTKQREQ